jgi:hypothetical protein
MYYSGTTKQAKLLCEMNLGEVEWVELECSIVGACD